jgi:peptidoglycan/LPS O-acetylase OafA/YrhL
MNNKNRIPSLDGLRGIAIILVVLGHAFREVSKFLDIANLGVRVFFVISAYLIVRILKEDVEKGRFSIATFYFKRITRTFPAFYAYLIGVYLLLNNLEMFQWSQFWRAPIYLENYHPRHLWERPQWFVGHSWSLAVEEQFYVGIAILFAFLNKKRMSQKQLLRVLVGVIMVVPFIRGMYLYDKEFIPLFLKGSIHRSFETVADALAIGGVLALLPQKRIQNCKIVLFFKNRLGLLMGVILFLQLLNSSFTVKIFGLLPRYSYNCLGISVINIAIAIMLFCVMNAPNQTYFAKFLNQKGLTYIGLWSYSIYLWQQLWLFSWEFPLVIKLLGTLSCAVVSYYGIEIKFLTWRNTLLSQNEKNKNQYNTQ